MKPNKTQFNAEYAKFFALICVFGAIVVGTAVYVEYKGKIDLAKAGLQECAVAGTTGATLIVWQRECNH